MNLGITDGPADSASSVVVSFTGVELQPSGDGRSITVNFGSPKTIDLVQEQNGALDPAEQFRVPAALVTETPQRQDSETAYGALPSLRASMLRSPERPLAVASAMSEGDGHALFEFGSRHRHGNHRRLADCAEWRRLRSRCTRRPVCSDQRDAGADGDPARTDGRLSAVRQADLRVPHRNAEALPSHDGKSGLHKDDGHGRNDG
ncbi:MAG: DUF4382 domain-containing protein [Acetobacteraceae bacterium]